MRKIKLNKVYDFTIPNFQFGDLSEEECKTIYRDGRVASHLLERQLTKWFPKLKHIPGCKGYDHVDNLNEKYDAKNFTHRGLKFMPSNQIGSGRKFDYNETRKHAKDLTYICCDIVNFPKVRIKFVKGLKLLRKYPSASIPHKDRDLFFDE